MSRLDIYKTNVYHTDMDYRNVIDIWPSFQAMASDLSFEMDEYIPQHRVVGWYKHNSIPPHYWRAIIAKSKSRGQSVTQSQLLDAAK